MLVNIFMNLNRFNFMLHDCLNDPYSPCHGFVRKAYDWYSPKATWSHEAY